MKKVEAAILPPLPQEALDIIEKAPVETRILQYILTLQKATTTGELLQKLYATFATEYAAYKMTGGHMDLVVELNEEQVPPEYRQKQQSFEKEIAKGINERDKIKFPDL